MNIVEKYIKTLKNAYIENKLEKEYKKFENTIKGATDENINKLKKIYPDIPKSLIDLLKFVDGTYYRKYEKGEVLFYFLGSDIENYPYYLLSSEQIIKNKNKIYEHYSSYVDRDYEEYEVQVDKKIIDNSKNLNWLHFSDCMNNGGSSQLFIDFSPSKFGKKGQIIRFLHDPDELEVIADSFDEYLKMLIDYGIDFIENYE